MPESGERGMGTATGNWLMWSMGWMETVSVSARRKKVRVYIYEGALPPIGLFV